MTEAAKEAASHDEEPPLLTLVSMTFTLREGKKESVGQAKSAEGEVKKKLEGEIKKP